VVLVETDNFWRSRKSILRRKDRTVTDLCLSGEAFVHELAECFHKAWHVVIRYSEVGQEVWKLLWKHLGDSLNSMSFLFFGYQTPLFNTVTIEG